MRRRQTGLVVFVCLAWPGCGETGLIDPGQIPDAPATLLPDERQPVELDALEPDEGEARAAAATGDAEEVVLAAPAGLIDAEELAFLQRLNAFRASRGLAKLRVSVALTRASQAHAADMAARGYFSHASADGTSFAERVKRYYSYNTFVGENIAAGFATGDAVFAAWKASPGHRANMLSAKYTAIGIARVADADGVMYWTTDFGGKRDALLSAGFSTIASNGGFEVNALTAGVRFSQVRTLSRWHLFAASGGRALRRAGSAYRGSYGLRLDDPTPGAAAATQLLRAAPRVSYTAQAQARRVSGPSPQLLYLDFLDGAYRRIAVFTAKAEASTAWHRVSASAPSPAATRYLRVILYGGAKDGVRSAYDWDQVLVRAE